MCRRRRFWRRSAPDGRPHIVPIGAVFVDDEVTDTARLAGDAFDAPFSAPTTGAAPYTVYRVAPTVAFAFGTSEDTVARATRYRF